MKMGNYILDIRNIIGERINMDNKMERLYIEWCDANIKRIIDEWFYYRDYTIENVLDEREYIATYVTSSFLKWYIEKD